MGTRMNLEALRLALKKCQEAGAHLVWQVANGDKLSHQVWDDMAAIAVVEQALRAAIAEIMAQNAD